MDGEFTFDGMTYRVAPIGPRVIGELNAWLKEHVPDPRAKARDLCRGLPDGVAIEVWKDLAREAKDWPPILISPQGNRILTTTLEGAIETAWTLLREHNPGFTRDDAARIAARLDFDQINTLIQAAMPRPAVDPIIQAILDGKDISAEQVP